MVVTSNKPFGRWSEVFDDATVAAAIVDWQVHTQWSPWGDNYGLKTETSRGRPARTTPTRAGSIFTAERGHDSGAVDSWRVLRVAPPLATKLGKLPHVIFTRDRRPAHSLKWKSARGGDGTTPEGGTSRSRSSAAPAMAFGHALGT